MANCLVALEMLEEMHANRSAAERISRSRYLEIDFEQADYKLA